MIISNSEVVDFLKCERKHFYGYGLGIAPKRQSKSLSRGIIGHEALAEYYKNNFDEEAAFEVVQSYMGNEFIDPDMLVGLFMLLQNYFSWYGESDREELEIIAVEKKYSMPITESHQYGMRLDLLFRYKSGQFMGEPIIMDHKFLYDFSSPDDLTLNIQLPKYIGTLRHEGYNVKRGILNELRWRETKENANDFSKKFRRNIVAPENAKIRNILSEQARAATRIQKLKSLDIKEWDDHALRSINTMTCRNCPFVDPCTVELGGEDISLLIQTEFKKNDYGYEEDNE